MTTPILQTKIHIPRLRPNLVRRPRLVELLDPGIEKRLVLISAPAGYGKTTLIVEWLVEKGLPAAWLSLDEGDNDPVRFFSYLVCALQIILPEAGKASLAMLHSPQAPALEALLSLLINDLAETSGHFILVLDDYHVLQAQPIHAMVAFLLDHLPVQMHLVIGTRADPPLPVARLRGRGQLTEIRLGDLRFNIAEAEEFYCQTLGFPVDEHELTLLLEKAEGWAAGLQMAALALQGKISSQGKQALAGFVREFTGSNRYILDYLMEEVLQRQPGQIKEFLLQTCILGRLCAPLCDALLTEGEASHAALPSTEILEYLERTNLFLVPLDDQRQWYRYHHLFSDLLNQRLASVQTNLVPELHRRASAWHERHGAMNEAIEHALAAGDAERAGMLIIQAAEPALMRGEVITYMHWIERLPEAFLQSHPRLLVFQAWGFLFAGYSKEKIAASLSRLGNLADSPLTAPLRGYMALFQGKVDLSIKLLRQALDQLPESEQFLRGLAAICLANAYLSEYQVATGIHALEEIAQESQRIGNRMLAVLVYSNLAELSRKMGQLHRAEGFYLQAIDLATDDEGLRLPVASRPLAGLGDLRREWNDLEAAEQLLAESIHLSQYWMQAGFIYFTPPLIRVKMARGDWQEAQKIIDQGRKAAAAFSITRIDDAMIEIYQAWLWVVRGDFEDALRWVELFNIREPGDQLPESSAEAYHFRIRKYEQIILARLYLAQDQPAEALQLLDALRPKFEKIDRMVQVIEILILRARALNALGRLDEGLAALANALTLAEPEGYLRIFLDEGQAIEGLLLKIKVEDPKLRTYVQKLCTAFAVERGSPPGQMPALSREDSRQPLFVEPLSQREMDVLGYLPSPLTADEIADQLFVSVHTVRSHIKSIYSKLGAHSRLEAVEKARAYQLL